MKIWRQAIIIFFIAFGIRLYGLNAMGNTWDEYFYYNAARDFAVNFSHLDFKSADWMSNFEHPPLGKYVYIPALIWNKYAKPSTADAYRAPRLISAIIGSLTVSLVYLIGALFISRRVGLTAALIYGLLPPVLAYDKIIDLDVTMVFLFTAAMAIFLQWLKSRNDRWLWLCFVVASLAIVAKFNAIFIAVPLYGGLFSAWRLKVKNQQVFRSLAAALAFPFLAASVLFILWPWLWSDPIGQFTKTLNHWNGRVSEVFLGVNGQAPIYYFVVHFVAGVPALVLGFFMLGLYRLGRSGKTLSHILILWFAGPFLISFYHLRQDHLRYVLPVMPAVGLIAAIGFWRIADRVKISQAAVQKLAPIAFFFYLVFADAKIYPYFLNYYSELAGGPRDVQASNLFTLGFYGEGVKEATEYVNKTAAKGATIHFELIPDDVPYLDRPRLVRSDRADADYLIFNANALVDAKKRQSIKTIGYKEVYAVKADGAPFVWVYKKSP